MNRLSFTIVCVFLASLLSWSASAQSSPNERLTITIYSVSMVNTNGAPVSLTLATSVAGSAVEPVSNSDLYLHVTSIVASGSTKKITAKVSSVPEGTILTLTPATCTTSNSEGTLGTVASSPITLSTTNQTLIESIGSCYTGTGYTDGYQLTFTWKPDTTNYYKINATPDATTVTVTFTVTAS